MVKGETSDIARGQTFSHLPSKYLKPPDPRDCVTRIKVPK